jgi:hypothetical protein
MTPILYESGDRQIHKLKVKDLVEYAGYRLDNRE